MAVPTDDKSPVKGLAAQSFQAVPMAPRYLVEVVSKDFGGDESLDKLGSGTIIDIEFGPESSALEGWYPTKH
jgi:hypothetical protein